MASLGKFPAMNPTTRKELTHISHGFYKVTPSHAKELAKGELPEDGREKEVTFDGFVYWLCRTSHNNKLVWSISRPHPIDKARPLTRFT